MRKYYRQIAKARMKAVGIDGINRRMSRKNSDGNKLWREFVWGMYAAEAVRVQVRPKLKRKVRKIAPITG